MFFVFVTDIGSLNFEPAGRALNSLLHFSPELSISWTKWTILSKPITIATFILTNWSDGLNFLSAEFLNFGRAELDEPKIVVSDDESDIVKSLHRFIELDGLSCDVENGKKVCFFKVDFPQPAGDDSIHRGIEYSFMGNIVTCQFLRDKLLEL